MPDRRDNKNRVLNGGEYQRGDGRYMYRYKDADGATRYAYSWTLTQSDRPPHGKKCDKCLREIEREIVINLQNNMNAHDAQKLTLNSYFDGYIQTRRELKLNTLDTYSYMYNHYIRQTQFGKSRLCDIRYSDVRLFYNQLNESGVSISTIRPIHIFLHAMLAAAVRDGCIRENPTDGIFAELKRAHNYSAPKRHALSIREQRTLLKFIRETDTYRKWYNLCVFLLGTGCRIGEATALTWDDCDFQKGVIHIAHALSVVGRNSAPVYTITTPKTSAGTRDIPMLSTVRDALLDERRKQEENPPPQVIVDGYTNFVFARPDGMPFTYKQFNKALHGIVNVYNKRETKRAEAAREESFLLPQVTAHIFRHTFCTRLCEQDVNIKVVQEIMGHSSISVTMDIYNELTQEKKHEAFKDLDERIIIT